jgi:hypothetical protein
VTSAATSRSVIPSARAKRVSLPPWLPGNILGQFYHPGRARPSAAFSRLS